MKLFGKKQVRKSCCCEGAVKTSEKAETEKSIKILGSGCAKCMELERSTRNAISELGLDFEIDHVTDFTEIAGYGVMSTPALVINGKVASYGRVLSVEEVKNILQNI